VRFQPTDAAAHAVSGFLFPASIVPVVDEKCDLQHPEFA
jgi:hypothetical protein